MAINRLNPDYPDAGLVQLLPGSVAVGSGSATTGGNGQVSFSGSSNVSVNDVFSSTYLNYVVYMNFESSNNTDIILRLRVSGSDDSNTNYHTHFQGLSTASSAYNASSSSGATSFYLTSSDNTTSVKSVELKVMNPFATERTMFLGNQIYSALNKANPYKGGFCLGAFNNSTSFTGFTIIPNAGTLTGTVSIYGIRN